DPGLPLLPIYEQPVASPRDSVRLDFGRDRGMKFPPPGFTVPVGQFMAGAFHEGSSATMSDGVPFALSGQWIQDGDRIATSDPKAHLSLHSPTPGMALVLQPLKVAPDGGRVIVEVNGIAAPDI